MKKFFLLPLTMALLCCAGCVSRGEKKESVKGPELLNVNDHHAAKSRADKFTAALSEALKRTDFTIWEKELPKGRKIDQAMFRNMCLDLESKYGKFISMSFLTVLDQGIVRDYLWKMSFSKAAAPPALPRSREIIFYVRIYQENGKAPEIGGFGIKPF